MKARRANEILAANIRRLMSERPALGTQSALARKSGIAQSSIQRVLAGAVHAQLDVIEAIATAFGVPIAELLMDSAAKNNPPSPVQEGPAGYDRLAEADKEKVDSYARFLLSEQELDSKKDKENKGLVSFADVRELSEEQLAQVMRVALRELNHNTLTSHDLSHQKQTSRKSRTGN